MTPEQLSILYRIIETLGREEIRKVVTMGTTKEEILEATNALAAEVGEDPLFVPEDFERFLA